MFGANKWSLVLVVFVVNLSLAQEKFTLLKSSQEHVNVREIIVGKPTRSAETTVKPSTKVPYKTLQCPREPIRIPIFSLPCNHEKDCRVFGTNLACCKDRCIRGVLMPVIEKTTTPQPIPTRSAKLSNEVIEPVTSGLAIITPSYTTTKPIVTIATTPQPQSTTKSSPALVCPSGNVRIPFFSLPCSHQRDCKVFGRGLLCCKNVCLQGVAPPKTEVSHAPALFGLVERHCPAEPLAELFDVRECETDRDCQPSPRICCPERNSLNRKSYCRTPIHNLDRLPGAQRIQEPLRNFVSYMQCTPPPPRELFPKPCNNTLDCFPNLCCQESGKKFCRPPRRSLVAWVADVTTRFGAAEATRKFIERITT